MENIYTKAMEIGYKNQQGISYFELKSEIEKEFKFSHIKGAELTFIEWFVEFFNQPKDHVKTNILRTAKDYLLHPVPHNATKEKFKEKFSHLFFIKGMTLKYYLDYVEIKRARQNANRAFYGSLIGIIIALGSLWLSSNAPMPSAPPYEVKIIEDKTSSPQLEKEVKELKEKLYMLISIYEEEKKK